MGRFGEWVDINDSPLERYNYLKQRKEEHEASLEVITKQLTALEPEIKEIFIQQGVNNLKTNDGSCLYLRRELYVGRVAPMLSHETICEQLHIAQLGKFAEFRPNYDALGKFVKKLDENDKEFLAEYPSLDGYLKVHEVFRVCRKKPVEEKGKD